MPVVCAEVWVSDAPNAGTETKNQAKAEKQTEQQYQNKLLFIVVMLNRKATLLKV